jgi:hypothetical protein
MALLPAEQGLTKKCSECDRRLTLDHFYIRTKKVTRDGRWYRMSRCSACFRYTRNANRPPDRSEKVRKASARNRALRRLAKMTPELFEPLYAEELAKEGLT